MNSALATGTMVESTTHVIRPARLVIAACLCAALTPGWLLCLGWPWWFAAGSSGTAVRSAAALVLALNGTQVVVLLQLRRLIARSVGSSSAERYVVALSAVLAVGVLGNLYLFLTSAPDVPPSQPHAAVGASILLSHMGLAVLLIAFGYSLLRTSSGADPNLAWFAHMQIAAGCGLATLSLAWCAALPMAAGNILLARLFWHASRQPAARRACQGGNNREPNVTLQKAARALGGRQLPRAGHMA